MAKSKSLLIVTGDAELDANLQALAGPAATRICNLAMKAGLKELVKAEQAIAPRKSGLLRTSLGERLLKRSRGFGGKAGINVGKRAQMLGPTGHVRASGRVSLTGPTLRATHIAPHGHLVALGTKMRTRNRIGGKFAYLEPHPRSRLTGIMPANPFIKRAAASAENTVKFVMRTAIKKGIAAEVNRWGKKHGTVHPDIV